jgi:hypothetical protein
MQTGRYYPNRTGAERVSCTKLNTGFREDLFSATRE